MCLSVCVCVRVRVSAARLGIQVNKPPPPPTTLNRSQKNVKQLQKGSRIVFKEYYDTKKKRWRAEAGLVLFTCQFVSQLYSGICVTIRYFFLLTF